MPIGLKRGTVELFPHEAAWEREAARTIDTLRGILGDAAEDLQHVGSTSVPAIKAKPIIDIAVAADLSAALAEKDALQAAGFYYRPDAFDDSQLLFACGSLYSGEGELQTHFIHVVRPGSTEWRNYLNFRDYLNTYPAAAKAYEAVKERLAAACPVDAGRQQYLAGKQPFITRTLRKATVWSYLGKRIRIEMDRPMGYVHQKEGYALTYPINYGYIPGVPGGDGEALDVYLLGANRPLAEAECTVVGIVRRRNDVEDKLIAAPTGMAFTKEEMAQAVRFQEQYYDSFVLTAADLPDFEEKYEN